MTLETFITNMPEWVLLLIILWQLPWEGIALWKAARNKSKVWFIVLFLLNTFAILEILYIFIFSKKHKKAKR